jgi:hypothetical protein
MNPTPALLWRDKLRIDANTDLKRRMDETGCKYKWMNTNVNGRENRRDYFASIRVHSGVRKFYRLETTRLFSGCRNNKSE